MAFTDHKIHTFTHKITDLADQPNLPPDDLKARFDSSPEELRQAVNAICDDADRLDARVSGIITETFGDSIEKSMLSDELADELDAKAIEASVAERFSEETVAREALKSELQQQIAQKCEIYCGSYTNSGSSKTVQLGFRPAAVVICSFSSLSGIVGGQNYADIAIDGIPSNYTTIVNNGFAVTGTMNHSAEGGSPYRYIAFKPVG